MKLSHNVKKLEIKDRPLRAVIYARVSTYGQEKEGHGLETQVTECLKKIMDSKEPKMIHVGTYKDGAVSGTRLVETRVGLKKLYDDAINNIFDAVFVYKVDRIGRTMTIVLNAIDFFGKHNIKIFSCSEEVDTSKSSGLMTLQMFAVIAQYEKNTIGERLMLGREAVLQQRGETGGKLPYGYKRGEKKKIEISEEEGKIVKFIFKSRNMGHSTIKISDKLNEMKIERKKSKKWYDATVGIILKNKENYEGEIRNNNVNKVRWPILLYDKILADITEIEELSLINDITVAIYLRTSTEAKVSYLKQQENEINEFLKDKNWEKYKVYSEICGEFEKRPNLQEMLEELKNKKIQYVIVKDLLRFGTNLNKLSDIFLNFLDNDIKIISLFDIEEQKKQRDEELTMIENFNSYINPLAMKIE